MEQYLREQALAGAQLFYAIYSLPKDKVTELFREASPGFVRAYARASDAFMGRANPAEGIES